ncbi:MAG: 50S ribosomal protein L18 [Candidatus Gracilibacteria bacterium]|nr:50S ribosomal protein L18 [Candidatus Gracilibacteria bacterium]
MLEKTLRRLRRKNRVRAKISGTASRPRLAVFRSNTHIYAQVIDDKAGKTLCSSSDLKITESGTKSELATKVGNDIAGKIKDLKISTIVFDRGGFQYHGRVKALAEAVRASGIEF